MQTVVHAKHDPVFCLQAHVQKTLGEPMRLFSEFSVAELLAAVGVDVSGFVSPAAVPHQQVSSRVVLPRNLNDRRRHLMVGLAELHGTCM